MSYYYGLENLFGYDFLNVIWRLQAGILVYSLIPAAIFIASYWKLFTKANEPGWASVVPFYDRYTICKITWGNGFYFFLAWIPLVGWVFSIITMFKLATAFGKDTSWGFGLWLLGVVFLPILAFSNDTQYVGVDGEPPTGNTYGGYQQNPYANQYGAPNQNTYQNPYQQPDYRQYQQGSSQNDQYRYQRTDAPPPPPPAAGGFCSGCGAALTPGTRFCAGCGKQV